MVKLIRRTCIDCHQIVLQEEYPSYKGAVNTGVGNDVLCVSCARQRGFRIDDDGRSRL